MRHLLQHVSRSFLYELSSPARYGPGRILKLHKSSKPFICIQCRHQAFLSYQPRPQHTVRPDLPRSRRLTVYSRQYREDQLSGAIKKPPGDLSEPPPKTSELLGNKSVQESSASDSTVHVVPDEDLPSHQEKLRWKLSKRFNQIMDDLMPKVVLASQRINKYTGTDYTGIEALRKEIIEQEKLVKARLQSVQHAKDALEVARARESSSRKEVVGLLERKHAWSDADLERYMNLIRSEHLNDQGIQAAKDNMAAAEMALEEARTRLEKRERMQYHEEQIWSDTIRRNSTWVTFGLMGVNIFLLLGTLILIEPWRRRRLVKEIRRTLEEQQALVIALPAVAESVDAVVEPKGEPLEALAATPTKQGIISSPPEVAPIKAEQHSESEAPLLDVPETVAAILSEPVSQGATQSAAVPWNIEYCKTYLSDFFSDRRITLRRVDITTIALEGAAAGAAIVALLIVLFRPK